MKRLKNFGAWVQDSPTAMILMILLGLTVPTVAFSTFMEKTVTIDGKHFACTATEPFGIEARCTQYTWVKGVR